MFWGPAPQFSALTQSNIWPGFCPRARWAVSKGTARSLQTVQFALHFASLFACDILVISGQGSVLGLGGPLVKSTTRRGLPPSPALPTRRISSARRDRGGFVQNKRDLGDLSRFCEIFEAKLRRNPSKGRPRRQIRQFCDRRTDKIYCPRELGTSVSTAHQNCSLMLFKCCPKPKRPKRGAWTKFFARRLRRRTK